MAKAQIPGIGYKGQGNTVGPSSVSICLATIGVGVFRALASAGALLFLRR